MESSALARNEIYEHLRADIISCRIPPGSELREGPLAERFEVSRSPVRDALHRLAVEQLVSVLPRRGYRITPISVKDAQDLREFRSVVEQAFAVKAAEAASDTDLQDLDKFRHFTGRQAEDFIAYNRAFHEAITRLSDNRRMADYAQYLAEQHDRLVRISISMTAPRDYRDYVREHCEIIDALQARDGRCAARLVGEHIDRGEKRITAALSRRASSQREGGGVPRQASGSPVLDDERG